MRLPASLNLLCLALYVVEVRSETTAYVSFMDQTSLANHSYVELGRAGDCVQCHTDVATCCSSTQGPHRGDWRFPDGSQVPFTGDVYEQRTDQRIDLCRTASGSLSPSGIYRCDIRTSGGQSSVYVGIYDNSKGIAIWWWVLVSCERESIA